MNLIINGHHLEITPAIRQFVTEKIGKVKRHFEHVIDINITLSVEKLIQKAEANVHMSGKDLFVEHQHDDLYAAIDGLIDKLDRQILKHKEKIQDHAHQAIKHQPQA
jgi:putative sigma-54 modulation protein